MKFTPSRRRQLVGRALTGFGRGFLAIGFVLSLWFCVLNATQGRLVHAALYAGLLVFLLVADYLLFPASRCPESDGF